MDDEMRAELANIEAQVEAELLAGQDATIRATHDLVYYRTLRANGIGRLTATLLTAVRAATD